MFKLLSYFITLLLLSVKVQAAAVNLPVLNDIEPEQDLFRPCVVVGPTLSDRSAEALKQEALRVLSNIISFRRLDLRIHRENPFGHGIEAGHVADSILSENIHTAIREFETIRDNPPNVYRLSADLIRLKGELSDLINTEI